MTQPNSMRLLRTEKPETRIEKALREIRERQAKAEYGKGEIDNTPTANVIDVDQVLRRSVRKVDGE